MILVDTSVWIDHFRGGSAQLEAVLEETRVLGHPWVTGELSLGNLADRRTVLDLLTHLPQATVATAQEVFVVVERHRLYGTGLGYVDAALLASTLLTPDTNLWTRDRRLREVAQRLGCAVESSR